MHKYLDSQFKTKFDALDKTIVFTTSKTLNERFTSCPTRRSFILNNGYTAVYKNNYIAERVAFENRRNMDIHKRISLYERGNFKVIERNKFRHEDRNSQNLRLAEIGNIRRTVMKPRKSWDEESTEYYLEALEKPRALLPSYCSIIPPTNPIEVHASDDLKLYELMQSGQSSETDYIFRKNSFIFENGPVKRTWDGRVKGENIATDDHDLKDYQGSEPIIYKPFTTSFKKKRRSRKSLYKWKRAKPTKEELDDELDQYMTEAKCKETSKIPVKDDVDYFVREYMLEAEKSFSSKNANINLK